MNRAMAISAGLVLFMVMSRPTFTEEDDRAPGGEVTLIPATDAWDRSPENVAPDPGAILVHTAFSVAASQNLVAEVEPNNTSATATPLGGTNVVRVGNIYPNADVDFWSFTASAGNRVYVATMTAASASGSSNDTIIDVIASDGVTVIETDDQNGFFSGNASTIAGTVIPVAGTYYIRVRGFAVSNQIRPYHLHFRLHSGAATAEVEPNDTTGTAQPITTATRIAGVALSAVDPDFYSFVLNAGDTVYLAVDADPERDTVDTPVRLGVGLFGDGAGVMAVFDDPGDVGPDSEAVFMTVKSAGTYYAAVSATAAGSYELSASVLPATPQGASCTTYTSTDVPKAIPDLGTATSTITVPGHPRIADIDVSIQLNHLFMPDIDAHLRSPQGNDIGLFTDIGNSMQTQMDLTIDDEAAIPFGFASTVRGVVFQPEPNYRLSWLDGEDAGGVWSLDLRDDLVTNAGTLTGWSLTICEPSPICSGTPVTLYQNDFESGAGGFTHSGTADEWERGLPTFGPITTCNSGVNCWKTDLDNTYDLSSNQDLVSPAISLTGTSGPITASWAQRYQMEGAPLDQAFVEVREVPIANPRRLFEWLDATMTDAVGSAATTINASAGWGLMSADISTYVGKNISLRFHLDSNATNNFAGLAIDDVRVSWCCTPAGCDDANICTTDGCDSLGCTHAPAQLAEASGLVIASNKQTLSWSAVPSATRYDVVRGALSALPVGPGGADEVCFPNLAAPTVSDGAVPATGAGFWYVVRGDSNCGPGTYGTTSGGAPRVTTTCP